MAHAREKFMITAGRRHEYPPCGALAAGLSSLLALSSEAPPRNWPAVRSVVVSGYGLANVEQDGAVVRLRVDRPGARVPLVLSSYEHVYWQILTTQGTQPAGVIASGYHAPAVSPDVATQGFLAGYGQPGYASKGHAPPRRSGGRQRPGHLAVQCGKGSGGPDLQGAIKRAHSPITGAYHGI